VGIVGNGGRESFSGEPLAMWLIVGRKRLPTPSAALVQPDRDSQKTPGRVLSVRFQRSHQWLADDTIEGRREKSMPRAYRPMRAESEPPRPVIGDSATKLGVRERDLAQDG
jgi:hypothetical protein